MGTTAAIAFQEPDKAIKGIRVIQDGQPSHTGKNLLAYWNTAEKIANLLEIGDLVRLGQEIGEAHDFDAYPRRPETSTWCRALWRDREPALWAQCGRRQDDFQVRRFAGLEQFLTQCEIDQIAWVYLYTDGQWLSYPTARNPHLPPATPLEAILASQESRKFGPSTMVASQAFPG